MSRDKWKGPKPNLSKLPPYLRKNATESIPVRDTEVHANVRVFEDKPGLNYPNGRIYATCYTKDHEGGTPEKLQLDGVDFTGKIPIFTILISKDNMREFVRGVLLQYMKLGGSEEDLKALLNHAKLPPRIKNPLFEEEDTDE